MVINGIFNRMHVETIYSPTLCGPAPNSRSMARLIEESIEDPCTFPESNEKQVELLSDNHINIYT